jgi:hypothetical protein
LSKLSQPYINYINNPKEKKQSRAGNCFSL